MFLADEFKKIMKLRNWKKWWGGNFISLKSSFFDECYVQDLIPNYNIL